MTTCGVGNRVDVAVIGGGPAGLMAALAAAAPGRSVVVYEKLSEPGRRLLASGGGRSNFTNILPVDEFVRSFGQAARFVAPAIRAFPPAALMEFFEELGQPSGSPDGFHVFPLSDSAKALRDALLASARGKGVVVRSDTRISGLRLEGGRVTEVETCCGPVGVAAVVLAAGGMSYRALGGSDDGYFLARMAGHGIRPPRPALVPLVSVEEWPGSLAGVTLQGVRVRRAASGRERHWGDGDLLFTHRGLSGPAVLNISGAVASLLDDGIPVPLIIQPFPDRAQGSWKAEIDGWRGPHGAKQAVSMLDRILPRSLAVVMLKMAGEPNDRRVSAMTREGCRRLAALLDGIPVSIKATEGFAQAMVTRGGIETGEVDPRTMRSRLAGGLFLAGEVLDVDGPCGGFNLQWAFSSGRMAGISAGSDRFSGPDRV